MNLKQREKPACPLAFLYNSYDLLENIIIQIIGWVQILSNDAVDLDCAEFKRSVKTNAFLTIIANLRRIQITEIALSAFDALAIVQYATCSVHK